MATGDIQIYSAEHNPRPAVVGDGTGDYVQINAWGAAREAAGTADTVGTFTAWVNIKAADDSYSILSAGDTDAIEYINFQIVNGKLNITLADGGAVAFDIEADGDDIPVDTWTHIAVVQDGIQPRLYVNGKVIATTNDTSIDITKWFADLNGIDNANIGILSMNTSTTLDLDGAIGQVKHWNAALTAEQILDDFNAKAPASITGTPADLISWWDFNGNLDDSVAGHDGSGVNNLFQNIQFSDLTAYIKAQAWIVADKVLMSVSNNNNVYNFLRIEA